MSAFKLLSTAVLLIFVGSFQAFAQPQPKYTKVTTTPKVAKDGKVSVEFKVAMTGGTVVNDAADTPWSLKTKDAANIKFAKEELAREELNKSLPGFSLTSTDSPKGKYKFGFRLVAFVCTEKNGQKDQCFREVHNGIVEGGK